MDQLKHLSQWLFSSMLIYLPVTSYLKSSMVGTKYLLNRP